jgi:hypothetical protein
MDTARRHIQTNVRLSSQQQQQENVSIIPEMFEEGKVAGDKVCSNQI